MPDISPEKRVDSLLAKKTAIREIIAFMTHRVEIDVYPTFDEALQRAVEALGSPMACLHLADDDRGRLNLVQALGMDSFRGRAWERLAQNGPTAPARAYAAGEPVAMKGHEAPGGFSGIVAVPVKGGDEPVGTLCVMWPSSDRMPPDQDRITFLETVGRLIGLAIDHAGLVSGMVDNLSEVTALKAEAERRGQELDKLNRELTEANRRLAELSRTDGLTRLFNHRHIHELLSGEIVRAKRQGHPVTVLMSDLDHFKRVNDTLGHQAGDEALRLFGGILQNGVRAVDMVGRYGGEEFLVVLVDCDMASGIKVGDKLRREVKSRSMKPPFDSLGGFTVSIGVAQLEEGMSADALIAKADEALYQAKKSGRDKVIAAPPKCGGNHCLNTAAGAERKG